MLNPKDMKSGDILLHKRRYSTLKCLLLSDLAVTGDSAAFTANVFWFDEYWFKEQDAILYQSECWSKLC